jgi:CRP-like cAMP-binding protein
MGEGCFFGEVALLKACPRTANIRAATHCDIRVLKKKDLDRILTSFPDMKERLRRKAEERFARRSAQNSLASLAKGPTRQSLSALKSMLADPDEGGPKRRASRNRSISKPGESKEMAAEKQIRESASIKGDK